MPYAIFSFCYVPIAWFDIIICCLIVFCCRACILLVDYQCLYVSVNCITLCEFISNFRQVDLVKFR